MATTPTTVGTRRNNGRARRRRNRRARIREELRACRGGRVGDQPDVAGDGVTQGSMAMASVPGLPVTGGLTTAGEAWAIKALHPNGEEATGVLGIPDHVSLPVVTPEFRTNHVIPSIGTEATKTDDLDILVLPFADLPILYRRYTSGSAENNYGNWTPVWNATLNVATQYVSTAVVDDATTTGDPMRFTVPVKASDLNRVYGYGRVTHKGVTCHLDAPALTDQGRIIAGQVALPFKTEMGPLTAVGWQNAAGSPKVTKALADFYSLDSIPLEENCLVQTSPGAATWEARQGVYVPLRFRDPAHQFSPSGSAALLGMTTPGGTPEAVRFRETVKGPTGTEGTTAIYPTPRMLLNCQTGVVLMRGIAPTASVHLKVITGLESLVETCSAVSPYQRMSPSLDCEAINMVTRMGQELPQAYPASYNDFGFLGGLINTLNPVAKKIRTGFLNKIPLIGKFWDWQEENIYSKMGLAGPQNMPTMTGYRDPLRRVYDRMAGRRTGYGGMYG